MIREKIVLPCIKMLIESLHLRGAVLFYSIIKINTLKKVTEFKLLKLRMSVRSFQFSLLNLVFLF